MHLPSIGLSLLEMDLPQQADALRDGRIDLGIVENPPADADRWLRIDRVFQDPLVAALPSGHPLAHRKRLSLINFADEPFVLFPRPVAPTLYDDIIARCRAARFSPRVVQEARGWHTMVSLVSAGVGVAFVPQSLGTPAKRPTIFRPVRDLRIDMELLAMWKRDERSPVRERFLTALKTIGRARRA
jgi:DNA-binding transcriptional LysR family regulator